MGLKAAALARDWYQGFQNFILEEPSFNALQAIFPFEPARFSDFNFCVDVHYKAIGIVHGALNDDLNDLMEQAFCAYIRDRLGVPPITDPDSAPYADALDENGFCLLPSEPRARAEAIAGHMADRQIHGRPDGGEWQPVGRDEARQYNVARYDTPDILANADVIAVATRPDFLAVVESHLGCTPTLINLSCWRSHAGLDRAKEAQFHHFDLDDYRFCKLFIYLSDAGQGDGPHIYVPGSHRADRVRAARDNWSEGPKDFMDWYLKSVRKSDQDVAKAFGPAVERITGRKGDCFITNTAGIHKGELPRDNDRFLVQIQFAATPMMTELRDPEPLWTLSYPDALKEHLADPSIAYVTRLFIDQS